MIMMGLGCGTPTRDEITGRYTLDYGYGVEELTLRVDGTYQQRFQMKGQAKTFSSEDRWDFKDGSDPTVILRNCMTADNYFGKPSAELGQRSGGICGLHVQKTVGRLKLVLNPEVGLSYRKSE